MAATFIKEKSPHIRRKDSINRMMLDVIIALLPVTVFAFVMNGLDALKVVGISLIVMVLCEALYIWIRYFPTKDIKFKCDKEVYKTAKERWQFRRKTFIFRTKEAFSHYRLVNLLSPIVSALIFAMCMPAHAPWWTVVLSSMFGIVIAKLVFGGVGSNIFNPAAAGRLFFGICFGTTVSSYSNNFVDVVAGGTPLTVLVDNPLATNSYSLTNLFTGMVPGALGEVSAVCILAGAAYLFIRRAADWRPTLSMLVTFGILILCAGTALGTTDLFRYAAYHGLAGGLLFGAVFMVTDPVTTPASKFGRYLFGVCVAICTFAIRIFGAYPEGVAFSILICNIFVPLLDSPKIASNHFKWYQPVVIVCMIGIMIGITFIAL